MADIKRTIKVSTNIGHGCDHCDEFLGLENFTDSINHLITDHGYQVLHVGQETSHDMNGHPWHSTVAVLGHDDPPAVKPPVEIHIGGLDDDVQT